MDGLRVVAATVIAESGDELRALGDRLRDRLGSGVGVLAAVQGDRASMIAVATDDAVQKGARADQLIRQVAPLAGGRGGGKANMAQAGGADTARLDAAPREGAGCGQGADRLPMSAPREWLRARLAGCPPELLQAMVDAVPDESPSVAESLAQGAVALLRQVATGSGGRENALPLLAADALLTHACEAQLEEDPGGLQALAERWGAGGALGALLADEVPR